jgi:hypothetical protein
MNDEISMVHGKSSRIQNFGNKTSYTGIFFYVWLALIMRYELNNLIIDSQVIESEQFGPNFKLFYDSHPAVQVIKVLVLCEVICLNTTKSCLVY